MMMNWKRGSNSLFFIIVACLSFFFVACFHSPRSVSGMDGNERTDSVSKQIIAEIEPERSLFVWKTSQGELELVDIQDLDSTFWVDIKYAGTDNFMNRAIYKELDKAFLQAEVAAMLVNAHRYLKELHPDLRFLVYDAARPLCIQEEMYEAVKNTPYHLYVAAPERTSLHNYAAAVDLTVADTCGVPLDMGTKFDHFGKAAGISYETELLEAGILNRLQIANRLILRTVMLRAGFKSISGEWWHFNACSLREARQKYPLIECF